MWYPLRGSQALSKLFVLYYIFCEYVSLSQALLCYSCKSEEQKGCAIPFDPTQADKFANCRSCATHIIDYENRIHRLCDLDPVDQDGCQATSWGKRCVCTSNLCNNVGLAAEPEYETKKKSPERLPINGTEIKATSRGQASVVNGPRLGLLGILLQILTGCLLSSTS